jgi:5-methylcytosine-specific restriction endonuclease McrA
MKQLSKPCAYCGTIFFKSSTTSLLDWTNQSKYCSHGCYWKAKIKKPSKACPSCGKLFNSRSWDAKAIYCSQECVHASQKKPLPFCELCGKQCQEHGRRFCSRACKVEWYRGKEVFNYAGGQARDHYASSFWLKLAEEIRKRDVVCQRCGKLPKLGTKLHVHHVNPWRYCREDNPDNLQALCPSCHKKADSELGL